MPFSKPNDMPSAETLQRFADELNAMIEKVGFGVIMTEYETPQGYTVPFCYSVGLALKGLPELVTLGIPHEYGRQTINNAAALMLKDQLKCSVAQQRILQTAVYPMPLTTDQTQNLSVANSRAGKMVAALQLVYPDERGFYPWESNYNPHMRLVQPLLYHKGGQVQKPVPAVLGGDDPRLLAAPVAKAPEDGTEPEAAGTAKTSRATTRRTH